MSTLTDGPRTEMGRLWIRLRRAVRIDTRSLAIFRVIMGLVVVVDILLRTRNFGFYYTDDGAVPQSLAQSAAGNGAVSLYYLTDDPAVMATLFGLQALVGLALLVGYRSPIVSVLAFGLVASLHHHNPFVLTYGDTLFRLLLFWAMFLPLGERWSIDALQAEQAPRRTVTSLGTAAVLLQMVVMYSISWIHKLPSERWHTGMAGVYVFGIDELTYLLGDLLRSVPTLVQLGSLGWFYLLMLAPFLVVLQGRRRSLLAFLFMSGHLAFALTIQLGVFPYVALAGLWLFLQPAFWQDTRAVIERLGIHETVLAGSVQRVAGSGHRIAAAASAGPRTGPRLGGLQRVVMAVITALAIWSVLVVPTVGVVATEAGIERAEPPQLADGSVGTTVAALGVSQPVWRPFGAPEPRSTDRWYVFPAVTTDGTVVDVFNDRPMSWERPHRALQRQHDTYRERTYMAYVRRFPREAVAAAYGDHLCDSWTSADGARLAQVNMWQVREAVTRETLDQPSERERTYIRFHLHPCGDRDHGSIAPPPDADPATHPDDT